MSQDLIKALEHCEDMLMRHSIDAVNGGAIEDEALNTIRSALSRHRSSVESVELDARRYRLLRDFDSADTELAICRWSEHGWCGEWVIEHDPDTEVDKAIAKREAR